MDATEQIKRFKEFIEAYYLKQLLEKSQKGSNFLLLDFAELITFDPELADLFLDQPEESVKAAEIAIEQFDIPQKTEAMKIRIKNLPNNQKIMIRDIRSKHIGKFLSMEGTVRQKSDVRPQVTMAKFECPSCGNIINVLQLDSKFKEPTTCGCGRKGKFKLINKELIDAQRLTLEEAPEDLDGGEQPKRMSVFLKNDLVSPITDKKTNPGAKISVVGWVKEIPITLKTGAQSITFDLIIEANYVEPIIEDFTDIHINKEDEIKIKELAEDPAIYQKIVNSVAPSIFGFEQIKEAMMLQIVGGVRKTRKDGMITRGDIHILLIGDPGVGKSQLLKRVAKIAPKARFVSGKGASGAGLTAAVVKDEFLNGWSLEAGALVLANRGICCIDELDKMTKEDTSAMHEALEGQTITIAKANIQATLRAETTVLAAANPKFGRFDPYDILAKQIDLPPALISRFDLIFPLKDIPGKDKDEKMAKHILNLHQVPDLEEPEIDSNLLKKYLVYCRQMAFPTLSDGALEEIKDYYVEMRNSANTEEGAIKAVPVTARQLEALIRLAEASAKVRLAARVTKKDAKRAINLLQHCLEQVGLDPETGKIDIDRISSGITTSQRNKIFVIKDIIAELENKLGKNIPIEEIIQEAKNKDIEEASAEEVIEKLKRSGDIFEPRRGFISKI